MSYVMEISVFWKVVHMPRGNVKGVFLGLAAFTMALGPLAYPSAAFAVPVNKSVVYDATATDNDKINRMYELDGIKYDVYTDSGCFTPAKVAGTTTNAQLTLNYDADSGEAVSNTVELVPGDYYIRENKNSCKDKGIAWNDEVKKVTVTPNNTESSPATTKFTDPIVTVPAKVGAKVDAVTGAIAQGDGTLQGCVIRIDYFDQILTQSAATTQADAGKATKTWYFKTDANGEIDIEKDTPLSSASPSNYDGQGSWGKSDSLYVSSVGNKRLFLLGSYLIREVASPAGYDLKTNAKFATFKMNNGKLESTVPANDEDFNWKGENTPNPGTVTITKVDSEALADKKGNITQGDSKHNAEFVVKNVSANAIVFYDSYKADADGHLVGVGNGKTVAVGDNIPTPLKCTRQANGDWTSNTLTLPYGSYEIREISGGDGMITDTNWVHKFSLHDKNAVEEVEVTKDNPVARAGLRLVKVDSDTVAPGWTFSGETNIAQLIDEIALGQGDAKLVGAQFTITNVSDGPVKVDGKWYEPGKPVAVIETYATKTTSGRDIVVANTKTNTSLPYGTYEVRETKSPTGYNPIVGLVGGAPVEMHPTMEQNGMWYFAGWDPTEIDIP